MIECSVCAQQITRDHYLADANGEAVCCDCYPGNGGHICTEAERLAVVTRELEEMLRPSAEQIDEPPSSGR